VEGNTEKVNIILGDLQSSTEDKGLQSKYIYNDAEPVEDISILSSNIRDILKEILDKISELKSDTTINNTYNNVSSEDNVVNEGSISNNYTNNSERIVKDNPITNLVNRPTDKPITNLVDRPTNIVEDKPIANLVDRPTAVVEDKPVSNFINNLLGKLITRPVRETANLSTLTANERQRYKEIFIILGTELEIGKFQKGPEADRLDTTPLPTPVASAVAVQDRNAAAGNTAEALKETLLSLLTKGGILGLLYSLATGNISGALQSIYRGIKVAADEAVKYVDNVIKPFLSNAKNSVTSIISVTDDILKGAQNGIRAFLGLSPTPPTSAAATGAAAAASTTTGAATGAAAARPPNPLGSSGPIPAVTSPVTPPVAAPARPPSIVDRFFTGAKNIATSAKNAALNIIPAPIKAPIGQVFNYLGGARGVVSNMAKTLKPLTTKLPIVGPVLELFFGKGDIDTLKQQRSKGVIKSDDELYQKAGVRVVEGLTGLAGGAAGAAVVGAIGSLGGPVGTVAGAVTGGLWGDNLGRGLASKLVEFIIPDFAVKAIGQVVSTAPPIDPNLPPPAIEAGTSVPVIPTGEMQDFIIKDGQVRKFSDKDEVLGMKNGGAISNLLSTITTNNNKQYTISERQIKILEEIRDVMKNILVKDNNSSTSNSSYSSNNQSSNPRFTPFTLRTEFDSMNNIATI
jgi:hypothetical protein